MMHPGTPSVVAFDLCDVLLYHDRHLDSLVDEAGGSKEAFKAFVSPLAVQANVGQLHFVDFHLAIAQFLALPTDGDHIIARLTPCDETHELAIRVHASGRELAITTNIARGAFELVRERTGLLPDVPFTVIESCEVGHAKPDPEFYLAALGVLKCSAPEVVTLDNEQSNVLAARSIGMQAEVFDPDNPTASIEAFVQRMPDLVA